VFRRGTGWRELCSAQTVTDRDRPDRRLQRLVRWSVFFLPVLGIALGMEDCEHCDVGSAFYEEGGIWETMEDSSANFFEHL